MSKKIKGIITGVSLLVALSAFAISRPVTQGRITSEKAVEIAKEHAKVSKDAMLEKVKLDREHGRIVYEVSFYDGNKEFDYEIDANTGEVIEYSQEEKYRFAYSENRGKRYNDSSKARLTRDEVIKIALEKVKGAKEQDIVKLKLDVDHGYEVYEVVVHYNNMRYEFDLNSQTGEVISWEEETFRRY